MLDSMNEIRIYDVLTQRNNCHFLGLLHKISYPNSGTPCLLHKTSWSYSNNLATHPPHPNPDTNMHHPLKVKLQNALNQVVQTESEARAVFIGGRRRNRKKRKHRTGKEKKKTKKQNIQSSSIAISKYPETPGDKHPLIESHYGSSATLSIDSGFTDDLPPLLDVDCHVINNKATKSFQDEMASMCSTQRSGNEDEQQFELELDGLVNDDYDDEDVFEDNEMPSLMKTLSEELEEAKENNVSLVDDKDNDGNCEDEDDGKEITDNISFSGLSMEDLADDEENEDIIYSRLGEENIGTVEKLERMCAEDLKASYQICVAQVRANSDRIESPLIFQKSSETEPGNVCCTIL